MGGLDVMYPPPWWIGIVDIDRQVLRGLARLS